MSSSPTGVQVNEALRARSRPDWGRIVALEVDEARRWRGGRAGREVGTGGGGNEKVAAVGVVAEAFGGVGAWVKVVVRALLSILRIRSGDPQLISSSLKDRRVLPCTLPPSAPDPSKSVNAVSAEEAVQLDDALDFRACEDDDAGELTAEEAHECWLPCARIGDDSAIRASWATLWKKLSASS